MIFGRRTDVSILDVSCWSSLVYPPTFPRVGSWRAVAWLMLVRERRCRSSIDGNSRQRNRHFEMDASYEGFKIILERSVLKQIYHILLLTQTKLHITDRSITSKFALRNELRLIIVVRDSVTFLREKLPFLQVCALSVTGAQDPAYFVLPRQARCNVSNHVLHRRRKAPAQRFG